MALSIFKKAAEKIRRYVEEEKNAAKRGSSSSGGGSSGSSGRSPASSSASSGSNKSGQSSKNFLTDYVGKIRQSLPATTEDAYTRAFRDLGTTYEKTAVGRSTAATSHVDEKKYGVGTSIFDSSVLGNFDENDASLRASLEYATSDDFMNDPIMKRFFTETYGEGYDPKIAQQDTIAALESQLAENGKTRRATMARTGDRSALVGAADDEERDALKDLLNLYSYGTAYNSMMQTALDDENPLSKRWSGRTPIDPTEALARVASGEFYDDDVYNMLYGGADTYMDLMRIQNAYSRQDFINDISTVASPSATKGSEYDAAARRVNAYLGYDFSAGLPEYERGWSSNDAYNQYIDNAIAAYDANNSLLSDAFGTNGELTDADGNAITYGGFADYIASYDRNAKYAQEAQQRYDDWSSEIQNKYGSLTENPDFAEKSQYVPTDVSFGWGGYETNESSDAPGSILRTYLAVGMSGGNPEGIDADSIIGKNAQREIEVLALDRMTDDERKKFYYLYNSGRYDEAMQYIDDLQWNLHRQRVEEMSAEQADYVNRTPVLPTIQSFGQNWANNIASGIVGASKAMGYDGFNEYSPIFDYGRKAEITRGETGQYIAENAPNVNVFGQNVFEMLYQGGTSLGDSLLNTATFGRAGALAMGAGAFGNNYRQNLESGMNDHDAYVDALVSGGFEAATEYLSIDALLSDPSNPFAYFLKNAITEGLEEGTNDVLNLTYDQLKYGIESEINRRIDELRTQGVVGKGAYNQAWGEWVNQLGADMLVGAISGGIGGAGGGMRSYAQNVSTGRNIQANNAVNNVMELARGTSGLSSRAQNIVNDYFNQLGSGRQAIPTAEQVAAQAEAAQADAEQAQTTPASQTTAPTVPEVKISNAQLGFVFRDLMQQLDQNARDVSIGNLNSFAQDLLSEYGYDGDAQNRKALADKVMRFSTMGAEGVTQLEMQDIMKSSAAMNAVQALTGRLGEVESVNAMLENTAAYAVRGNRQAQNPVPDADTDAEVPDNVITDAEAAIADSIELAEKRVQDAGDVSTEEADSIRLKAFSEAYGKNSDIMANAYDGNVPVQTYAAEFAQAAQYGQDGQNFDVVKSYPSVSNLSESQIRTAYELGRGVRSARNQETQQRARYSSVPVGNIDMSAINLRSLNDHQMKSVQTMKRLAKAVGFNVAFVESKANAQGQYTTENGSWDSKTLTLTLDVHAGSNSVGDTNYAMMHTAGHELTHYIRQMADSRMWDSYQEFVIGNLSQKMDLETEIQKRMAQDSNLDRDGAIEEIIADSSGEALLNISETQVRQLAETNPGLLKKIGQFIQKWIDGLKKSISAAFKDTEAKTEVAKQMVESLDEMSRRWNDLLVNAAQNRSRAALGAQASTETATDVQDAAETVSAQAVEETVAREAKAPERALQPLVATHIDARTTESVRSADDTLFLSEVEEAKVAYSAAANILLYDVESSITGQKFFTDDSVTGQKRMTSDLLARMKDETGWTWDKIRSSLQTFADMGDADKGYPEPKNTVTNRVMELYLDEMLTNGYTTLEGVRIAPWEAYVQAKAQYEGSRGEGLSVKADSDAVAFEDYAFPEDGVKYSLRDYSYDELINKPDMPIVSVDTGQNITREDAVKAGRTNVVQYAEKFDANGAPAMMVDDLGKYVYVGAKAMRHGLDRRANYQNGVITRIGDILKNSIVINEANPKKDGVKNTWILMGLARDSEGNLIYIRSIVNQSTFEVEDMAAMYAVLGKKSRTGRVIATDANAKARGVPANPTISVAEMLEGVKDYFSDVLSADVVKRLGMKDRQTSEFTPQLRYQLRDPYQISNREILANALEGAAQNETERDWLKRYKKKARALGEKQMRLEDINARIVSLRKSENTLGNRETLRKLEAGAKVLSDSIQRADKEMLKLESFQPLRDVMKRERATWNEKARAKMNERISEYKADQREKVRERIQAVRESETEKRKRAVEHTREVGQRRVERLKESEMKAKYKAHILKDSATMREWLTRPTTKGHVPEFLRGPLGAFMESLDFTSDRALRGGDPTQADRKMLESMEAMRRALASVKKQQSDIDDGKAAFSGYLDLPGGFAEEFDDLTERIKQTLQQGGTDIPINRMTGEQLKSLSRMIRAINTSVRNMNRLLANAKYESAVRAADSTMAELAKLGDKVNTNTVLDKARNFMDWTNATPYYVFKRFGDGGKAIFEGLMDGWDRLAFNSKELIDYTNSLYKPRQVREWSRELHTVALSGKDVQLTAAQIMSLYCLSKREQAVGHLLGGGIRVGDIQSKGKQIVQADNYTLNMEDIQAITGKLTAQQKEVADKLQSFMSTRCAEWGNEVSMKRFGYEMFGEENYFPIKTDSNNRKAIDDQAQENSLFRLLNLSATKSLVQNANNAIILENIFDVFSAHATDMAKYNALGLQILDALKWYNYVEKTVNEDGTITTASVQKSLEKAYGRDAQRYIKNFLRDLNGVREGGRNDGLFNMFVSNYKIAAVAANLRVGLLQITSMPRAAYAIHPKYLAIGMAKNVAFRNSKIAEEKVGISLWKSLGFYDTNIARNVREMVKHDQGIGGTIREKSMILAEKGDAWTMGVLYGAVEAEMAEKHRDVRKGSAAYDKMLNDRMREIIYQTQVVDSTMTRSDIMRDRSKAASLATAFMSEPTLTMNMLADSIFEQRMKARETGKRFMPSAKMWKAFAVNSLVVGLAAIMESLFTAERDDDEYETFMEKFVDALVGEYDDEMTRGQKVLEFMNSSLGGNMNLLNNIPYVKNVIDGITNGEGSSALYDEWIVTLFGGIQEVYKYATGQSSNPPYNGIYKTINGLSQMSGFALGSLTRELVSAYNTFIAEPLGYKRIQTYTDSASDAASAILRAYLAGDDELAAHYTSIASQHGIEGEKLEKAMNNAARDAFEAGSIDAATAQDILSAYGGKGENDAYWIVREWESGEEDYSRYGNLRTALAEGDGSAATAAYHELVEHGVEEKTVLGEISKLYNSGEATNLLNLQLRSNNLYTSTLKLETDGEKHPDDFDGFITAIVNGRGISTEIGKLLEKGYTVKQCMSAINGAFGKSADRYRIMEQYNRSDAATLLNRILDAYEVLGLDRNEEKAWIDANWIMEG